MGRLHYRIPIASDQIYATNLRSSGLFVDSGEPISGVVHFVLEKFQTLLSKAPFKNAQISIFSEAQESKFEAVKRTKKALLLEDAWQEKYYRSEDPALVHYEKEIDSDLLKAISIYKDHNIRSEIVYPILFSDHLHEDTAIGYIQIQNGDSVLAKENLDELYILSNSMVKEILKLSDARTSIRFQVMDISFSGIRLRIHDDLLIEPLRRAQEFFFDLILKDERPVTVKTLLRWWSRESDGLLDLGLEIDTILGEESEKDWFWEKIEGLREIEIGSEEKKGTLPSQSGDFEKKKKRLSLYQNKRILYIDSNLGVSNSVKSILTNSGYEVTAANSVTEALGLCLSSYPCLIIVDTNFPNLDGVKFLRALRKISPGSMFIIFSSKDGEERLIHYLSWVWAYLEKQDGEEMLLESVHEAIDFHFKRMSQFHLFKADEEDLTGEIEWLLWKDYHRNTEQLSLGKNILNNVTHSTSQGLGLGSLLIQLDLAEYFMKEEGEEYLVPIEVMNSILENKRILREWTEKLEKIRCLFHLKIVKEKISSRKIMERISETIQKLAEVSDIKKNHIIFIDKTSNFSVLSSLEFVDFTIRELLINALKFSPQDSKIHILVHSKDDHFCIDILNDIEAYGGGISGIPEQFSSLVFEPFSKLNHNYDERFFAVDFGLGIGLNLASHLATRAGGELTIKEVMDHSGEKRLRRISAEIRLPIVLADTEIKGKLSGHSAELSSSY